MLVDDRTDERPNEPAPPEVPRRAYWPLAVLLLGALVALLGGAFLLDQRYRPPVGVEPVTVAVVAQRAPAEATVAPSTAVPTPIPTAPSNAFPPPTTLPPTAVPTVTPAASPTAVAPVPGTAPSAASLLSPLQKEVADAYLRYWDRRIKAYELVDPTRLSEVMAGVELEREQKQIEELRAKGHAAKLDAQLNFRIAAVSANEAEVYDEYVNRSIEIEIATKRELAPTGPPQTEKVSYFFKKIDGTWKVVDGVRRA